MFCNSLHLERLSKSFLAGCQPEENPIFPFGKKNFSDMILHGFKVMQKFKLHGILFQINLDCKLMYKTTPNSLISSQ